MSASTPVVKTGGRGRTLPQIGRSAPPPSRAQAAEGSSALDTADRFGTYRSDYELWLAAAGLTPIAGVDEAGRGACAGPLVAAAVILDDAAPIVGLGDSKALTARGRERAYDAILARATAVSWVEVSAAQCDTLGIQAANLEALRRAAWKLAVAPRFVLTDGFAVDGLPGAGLGMWKADQVAACVQAASIIAKVTRDRLMTAYDQSYPGYGFAGHKGYVTGAHQARLEALGASPIHRLTYANVQRARASRELALGAVAGDATAGPDHGRLDPP